MTDEAKKEYECSMCGNRSIGTTVDRQAPECCGRPMVAKDSDPVCLSSDTPEHARSDADDGPCDDGRGG